jgi:hypothetical protein
MMRKIIFIVALMAFAGSASSQTLNPFPTTDSLRKFINKWIRNSAVDAFTNLRLNTALIGMSRFVDSADSGLSPTDTASMLAGYTRLSRFMDSVSALRAAIGASAQGIQSVLTTGNTLNTQNNSILLGTNRLRHTFQYSVGNDGYIGFNETSRPGITIHSKSDVEVPGIHFSDPDAPSVNSALSNFLGTLTMSSGDGSGNAGNVTVYGNGLNLATLNAIANQKSIIFNPSFGQLGIKVTDQQDSAGFSLDTISIPASVAVSKVGRSWVPYWGAVLDTIAAMAGGGGTPGGSSGQIQYNNAGAFAGAFAWNNALQKATMDSLVAIKVRTDTARIGTYILPNPKNWWFFGTSITNRFGLSDTNTAWINLVGGYYGKYVKNKGVDGAVIIKSTPLNPFGGQNMIDYMQTNLLTKTAADERLFLAFGENDFNVNSVNYTPTAYRLAYDSVVNFAITKGYSLSDIVIVGPGYIDTTTNSTATRLRQIDFNDTLRTFAANKGVMFVDIWAKTFSQPMKYFYLPQGTVTHPGPEGHSLYADLVKKSLGDVIVLGGQRAIIDDTTEVRYLKTRSVDTPSISTRPLGVSPSGRVIKFPLNYFIPNDPVNYTNGRIKLNGDIFAKTISPLFLRGGTGNRQTGYTGTAWELFSASNIAEMYAFDQTAVAWRQGSFHAANFLWQIQSNTSFQLAMSTGGVLESTQNNNSLGYFSVGNSNTGTSASAELRVGPNGTAGNGGRLAYFSTGFTPNGIYTPASVLVEAGPTTATGLNLSASNAAGVMKFFTGGIALSNERMRIAADGQLSLYKTLTGTNAMRFLVKGTDSIVYQIDASSLPGPSLTSTYIGVGNGSLSGSTAYTYDGTAVRQSNSGALHTITSTTALGSTSGGNIGLYATGTPSASSQVVGTVEYGSLISGNYRLGATIRGLTSGAWTDGSNYRTDLAFAVTNGGSAVPSVGMRLNGGGRLYVGANTVATATLELAAGSTSVAPFKLTAGTNKTTAAAGEMEYDGTSLFFTPTGTTRLRKVLTDNSIPANGQIPIGNGANYTNATLTQGTGISITNGAGSITFEVPTTFITSGTYTPTITNGSNVAGSTAYECQYMRVGSVVTVSGRIDIDPTLTATSTQLTFTLPISSAFGASNNLGGTAYCPNIAGMGAAIQSDGVSQALVQYVPSDLTNNPYFFSFTYRIIVP